MTALPGYGLYRVYHKPGLTELELSCGAEWAYPRMGQNDWNDWTEKDFAAVQEPFDGNVCGWLWIDPEIHRHQRALGSTRRADASRLMRALAYDIEDTWARVPYATAKSRFLELRDHAPNLVLGYCPVDTVGYRAGMLDETYAAASEVFDFCDPQDYPWEHSDQGAAFWRAIWEPQWVALEKRYPSMKRCVRRALGATYRPRTRGYRKDPATGKDVPIVLAPMDEAMRARLIADVRAFRAERPDCPLFTSDTMDPHVAAALQADFAALKAKRAHDAAMRDAAAKVADTIVDAATTIAESASAALRRLGNLLPDACAGEPIDLLGPDSDEITAPGTPTSKSSQKLKAVREPIIEAP